MSEDIPTTLGYLVQRKIDPIDNYDKSGAYIIAFKVNSSSKTYAYVGMSTLKLIERIIEHMTEIKKVKSSTALSRLNQNADIDILFKDVKVIAHASQNNFL